MPKLHHSILQSLPSERLRIGDCLVDAAVREITPDGGSPHRVSLKAVDLLLVLVAHAGKVVSRETLLETVWPDTLPGDDVVTQAVAQLRKAFDSAEPVIETIAKHGYRLRAPVQWLDVEPPALATDAGAGVAAATVAATVAPARPGPWRPALRIASVLGVALLGTAIWIAIGTSRQRAPRAAPPIAYQKITSAPGGEFAPSVSPDGALVVYSAYLEDQHRTVLMLQTTAPVEPRALTSPARGERDMMAAWSPDGREIAFVRLGERGCQLLRVAAAGGDVRAIGACDGRRISRFGWHPDGKQLVVGGSLSGPADATAIETIDLATGRSRKLVYARGANDIDLNPVVSPDGRWIAFQRNVSRGDLWRMPVAGGAPERLTQLEANLYGLAWAPDSESIVFSSHGTMGAGLHRLDLRTRKITDLGIENAMFPSVALKQAGVAFVLEDGRSAMFRVPIPERAAATASPPEPQAVFASSGNELLPSVSPDGRQLVFVSDRTGEPKLWWGEVGRPASLRPIEGFMPFPRHPPVWSADGRTLLAVGSEGADEALFEITPAAGRVQKLPLPDGKPTFASYLPDPTQLLVVADRGAGRLGLTLYDRSTRPWQVRAQLEDVALARFDPLGQRIVFLRNASWGLWQADLSLRNPSLFDDLRAGTGPSAPLVIPAVGYFVQSRRLLVSPAGTWVLGATGGCNLRWMAVAPARAVTARSASARSPVESLPAMPVASAAAAASAGTAPAVDAYATDGPCLDRRDGALSGVSFDATQRQLYYSYSTEGSQDIGWARLPQ